MSRIKLPDNLNKKSVMSELKTIKINPLEEQLSSQSQSFLENQTEAAPADRESVHEPRNFETDIIQPPPPTPKASKVKVNVYLSPAIKRRTEKLQIELREIAPPVSAQQINYSTIVEMALQIAFDDFEKTRNASAISREIMNYLKTK